MNFNFNKKGVDYKYTAIGQESPNVKILKQPALEYIKVLKRIISKEHENGDVNKKNQMISLLGCYERLEGFLHQSYRLSIYANKIYLFPSYGPGTTCSHRENFALYDYELLLFQGRAILDRLTFYISKQVYNQDCSRFDKLSNVLGDFLKKDKRAKTAIDLIEDSTSFFKGLLIDGENYKKSLRSRLIHKSTIGESLTCVFTIHTLPDGRVIRFDYEVLEYPLFGSTWILTKYIAYFCLNIIGLYLNHDKRIDIKECEPIWENKFAHFSSFIENKHKGIEFSIINMNPSGFELITRKLNLRVLNHAENKY